MYISYTVLVALTHLLESVLEACMLVKRSVKVADICIQTFVFGEDTNSALLLLHNFSVCTLVIAAHADIRYG